MNDKALLNGTCRWLRNQDLNLRPSGYEDFIPFFSNKLHKAFNMALFSYLWCVEALKLTIKYSHSNIFFTQHNTKINKTNTFYCTKSTIFNINKINYFFLILSFSRLHGQFHGLNFQAVKDKAHKHESIILSSRLHGLKVYIFVLIFFYFSILFFLDHIEKKGCEAVKLLCNYYKMGFSLSRLKFLSREKSREAVKEIKIGFFHV
jgi:hypothetical protein